MAEVNAGSGDFAVKGEKSRSLPSLCASESVIVHSGPRARSVLVLDAYVSVPVSMVLAKTDMEILPAVSCLCVPAARSSYQADIIVAASRKVLW